MNNKLTCSRQHNVFREYCNLSETHFNEKVHLCCVDRLIVLLASNAF